MFSKLLLQMRPRSIDELISFEVRSSKTKVKHDQ